MIRALSKTRHGKEVSQSGVVSEMLKAPGIVGVDWLRFIEQKGKYQK